MTTNPMKPRASGSASRLALWAAVALLIVLGTLGIIAAVRANPLASDRASAGISKYQFLEECKGQLDRQVREVATNAKLRLDDLQFQDPGLVVPQVAPREGGGWTWTSVVSVVLQGRPGGQAQFTCEHDKASGKTAIVALQ
ncbi:hypothetical protein [Deinococcus pimensis]|uniref:hypothetical protein n=1 Tax=Deinococcus pimensis TaxID=309888 RepID=UPI00048831C3|nr:hypothetical protein [Deinococcus pimensis]